MSVRPASSAENSTSSTKLRASLIIEPIASSACSRVMCSFACKCKSDVARKTCIRGCFAGFRASAAARMSSLRARASAAIGTSRTSFATAFTASRSPFDAIGNPASITSTPSAASCRAMRIFSSVFIENPGDCSPSLSVVSNIRTWLMQPPIPERPVTHAWVLLVQFIFILYLIIFAYTVPRRFPPVSARRRPPISAAPVQASTAVALRREDFPMDLGELQVFLMVAKEGSFSRAAERLYRTQPAVSLTIRKLENSLEQPLFVRGARPVRLTDAGTLLKEYAERLLNLRDEVKKGLMELDGLKRGELSLGVNESSIHALLPALAKYREAHPGVQVRLHRMFSRDIPHEVVNYRLDLGAVSFVPRDAQLQATEILKDELTLVVNPKHVLARKREVDVAELGHEDFIAHIVESPFRRRVIELFARNRTALNMPIEMPTIESIKRFVQMGMGVAIVPRMCVQWEIDHGWMKEVKVRQLNIPRHVYLVSRRGARLPHAAAELVRILRGE